MENPSVNLGVEASAKMLKAVTKACRGEDFKARVEFKQLSELKPSPKNARKHSKKQVQKIANSIKTFGFNNPILIDDNGIVVSGHGRYEAAQFLKLEQVPTICLEHLTEAEIKAFAIADNKLALESEWDQDMLKINIEELANLEFDLDATAFETPEIDKLLFTFGAEEEPKADKLDKLPDEKEIPSIVKPGDLYRVGRHYVYCGNSLDAKSYEILLRGEKAGMTFSDFPYNVRISGHVCESGKHPEFAMGSGEMSDLEFTQFLRKAMQNISANSTDGSIHFGCMDWRHSKNLLDAAEGVYTELKNICVWNKESGGMGSLYRSQHEFIFVHKNGTAPHINNVELGKHGRYRTNVWDYPGVRASNPSSLQDLRLHPTCKPVSMVIDSILDCSKPNDIVLDAFAGSGTTLLAAERTKRRAFVIELDCHYCDVILYRYMQHFKKDDIELILSQNGEVSHG